MPSSLVEGGEWRKIVGSEVMHAEKEDKDYAQVAVMA